MPHTSPSTNKILVDLAVAREAARVAAEDARAKRRQRAHRTGVILGVLETELPDLSWTELDSLIRKLIDALDGAGCEAPAQ